MAALAAAAAVLGAAALGGGGVVAYRRLASKRKRSRARALADARAKLRRRRPGGGAVAADHPVERDNVDVPNAGGAVDAIGQWADAREALDDLPVQGASLGVELGSNFGPIGAVIGGAIGLFAGAGARILGLNEGPKTVSAALRAEIRRQLRAQGEPATPGRLAFAEHATVMLSLPWEIGYLGDELVVPYPLPGAGRDPWKGFQRDWLHDPIVAWANEHHVGEPRLLRQTRLVDGFRQEVVETVRYHPPRGKYLLRPVLEGGEPGFEVHRAGGQRAAYGLPSELEQRTLRHLADVQGEWTDG